MGHLVNPLTFRLSKSKFWFSNWNNFNKKNYKKYFLEDLNNFFIFKWLMTFFNYKKIGYKLLDLNIIKNFKIFIYNLSIIIDDNFILDVLKNNDIIYKKLYFNYFFFKLFCDKRKSNYRIVNKKKIYDLYLNTKKKKQKYNKIFIKYFFDYKNNFLFFKNNNINLNIIFKKKIYFLKLNFKLKKYRYSLKMNKNIFLVKKKNWNKKFIKLRKVNIIKFNDLTYFLNKYYFLKKFKINKNLFNFLNFKKLQKNTFLNIIPIKKILYIFKNYLKFFLKNIFKIKLIMVNFFEKKSYRLSSLYIKRFIKFEIYKKGFRISHIINLIKKDLILDVSIVGFKLGYFGRYQKKLRNKDFYRIKGALAPSNINSVISYVNFVILLKQGISGIEICIIKKMKKNEIF